MDDLEKANLTAIRRLNQRGGRFLTVTDLLEAKTLSQRMLKFLVRRIWLGDSLLAAAGPSGTGKTTLMGALLNLIPPGLEIRTAERGNTLPKPRQGYRPLYLAHELNDAPYYGYIWGREARHFLQAARSERIAATLHAESLKGIRDKLLKQPVGLEKPEFNSLDLIVTMKMNRSGRQTVRKIHRVHESAEDGHREVFRWDPDKDEYRVTAEEVFEKTDSRSFDGLDLEGFIESLSDEKPRRLEEVRELLLDHVTETDEGKS
ncbi:MAG: hypothetical protein ACOC86_02260 [Candidatus Bipolaricaulota bacterium]